MLFILGVLIAIGAAVVFAAMGGLTIWGGVISLRSEVARDYVRTQAGGGTRAATTILVGLPLAITGFFGVLTGLRLLQVAFGLG